MPRSPQRNRRLNLARALVAKTTARELATVSTALADSAFLQTIETLDLSGTRWPTESIQRLLQRAPALRALELNGCGLDNEIAAALARLPLTKLGLAGNQLDATGCARCSAATSRSWH